MNLDRNVATDVTALPAVLEHVRHRAALNRRTLTSIERQMGLSHNSLYRQLNGRDPRIGLLVELSRELNHDLLQLYRPLLPANLHTTEREAQLQQQIDSLQAELEKLKKENAKLWAVMAGRV